MLFSGIDLHKRTIAIETVDGGGTVVRQAQLAAPRPALSAYFATLPGPHRAVVECTGMWYWVRDLLSAQGIDLRLGHAKYLKAISYAKVKTMMDEYLVPVANGLAYAPAEESWSCHYFARVEIVAPLNAVLRPEHRLTDTRFWFPTPNDPDAYDDRISDAGGIDLFLLASGATDGHVAFNPPGSPRASRTRVIPLSEATRRDNLRTFPAFGSLDRVPRHGVSVGISTIVAAREALMVVWGSGKGLTLSRMLAAERYQPDWPATLVHECGRGEIIADEAAASASRNQQS